MNLEEIHKQIVAPYKAGRNFLVNGLIVKKDDIIEIQIVQTTYNSKHYSDAYDRNCEMNGVVDLVTDRMILPFSPKNGRDHTNQLIFSLDAIETDQDKGTDTMTKITASPRKVFVIHGRNEKARRALFDFLRAVHLEPMEWTHCISLTGEATPFIGTVLDTAFTHAQAVIALLTGDDEARLLPVLRAHDEENEAYSVQARANVIFEAGMAMGRLPARTIFVELGKMRPFSDVAGRHTVRMTNAVQQRRALLQRLKSAGCQVDDSGNDWITVGDFDGAIVLSSGA